mmetsp:Transcript_15792/g.26447  ORF Transcript_15792/g.26447 Transcript_15792/m.26447 type:complete len:332 (-) Transcript_15792:155-1150(-)
MTMTIGNTSNNQNDELVVQWLVETEASLTLSPIQKELKMTKEMIILANLAVDFMPFDNNNNNNDDDDDDSEFETTAATKGEEDEMNLSDNKADNSSDDGMADSMDGMSSDDGMADSTDDDGTMADSTDGSMADDKKKKKKSKQNSKSAAARTCIHLPATSLQIAKERFETLERAIATDILQVMMEKEAIQQKEAKQAAAEAAAIAAANASTSSTTTTTTVARTTTFNHRQLLLRSLQIGTVSLVVGGLFAFTGGLAAPALVAAITAFGVGTAIIPATLTTTAALASMFGVVGGGLAAYKMKKRTDGLSDWRIRKETSSSTPAAAAAAAVGR